MLSNISVASSTNSSHGERPNKGEAKQRDPLGIFRGSSAATTADADTISVGSDAEAHFVTADIINLTTLLSNLTTLIVATKPGFCN